jgi:hypothetical protein
MRCKIDKQEYFFTIFLLYASLDIICIGYFKRVRRSLWFITDFEVDFNKYLLDSVIRDNVFRL